VRDLETLPADEPNGPPQPGDVLASGATVDDVLPGHTGRYRIVAKLGEGGFGVVYEADQEAPLRRRVALKIIKAGMDTRQVIARFEAERHALAMMDHPNIARVLDAGATDSGRPYFVMELVRGEPITLYCDRATLSLRERLELFRDVCYAVEHAHQKGIVHRDLKPSNVPVTVTDGAALPKVIDFGIAKATAGRLGDGTPLTELHQLIGTPQYMSPEQAGAFGFDIDTRSDVYSLGVLLYELLAGTTPLDGARLRSAPLAEIQRLICGEEPPRPSARIVATDAVSNTAAIEIARCRRSEPLLLARALRGDLDWIVIKCLEKDRARRYQTASALAEDVDRYLRYEPVQAIPPSAAYRLRKFVRRNRAAVIAGVVVVSALLTAMGLSLAFGISEARQREVAENARARAEQAESETKARAEELEQVAAFQDEHLSGIDVQTMGVRLRAGVLQKARAATVRSRPADAVDARVGELEELMAGSDFTGLALETLEENFFRPALEAIEKRFSDQPLVKARLLQTSAYTLRAVGLLEAATAPQEEALTIRRGVLGDDHPDTLISITLMGALLHAQGNLTDAERYLREAVDGRRRVFGDDHAETLNALNEMGLLLQEQGNLAEAETYYREALEKERRVLGDEHPNTLSSIENMGFLLQAQGRLADAEPYHREALDKSRRVLGDEHPDTLTSLNNMAMLLKAEGKLGEAEPFCREAVETRRRVLGDEHPDTLISISNLGVLLQDQGKLAEAETYMREALETRRRILADDHPQTLISIANVGTLLEHRGELAQAEPFLREAVDKLRATLGDEHFVTLVSIGNLGSVLLADGRPAEVVGLLAPAEAAARDAFTGGNALRLGRFLTTLGRARVALDEFELAQANLNEARTILGEAPGATERDRASVSRGVSELDRARSIGPG